MDTVVVMAGSLGRFSNDPIILLDSSISLRSKVDRGGEGRADENWLAKVTGQGTDAMCGGCRVTVGGRPD